ncbi:MAG: hypothetical protein KGM24_12305, partial [Elusimicrobia bacterium]|nr:hypothetical protein [Elusimicrobiota bacterium]
RVRRLALAALLAASAAAASAAPDARPLFARGRIQWAAGGGYGAYGPRDYAVLALQGDWFLRDGLSAGLSGEAWLGSNPQVYDLSPQVREVFLDAPWAEKPFVGAFYRRTAFSRGDAPEDSGGARAGVVIPLSARAYASVDLAYERYSRCDPRLFSRCDLVYPEVAIAFGLGSSGAAR